MHIKITLFTSQTKTLILFSSHQQTKKKLILSSLDITKATHLYSIPDKALELLKNDISNRTANLFII